MIDNFVNYQLLEIRVKSPCMVIDRIISCDLFRRCSLYRHFAHLCHIFELQHIKSADQSYFYFYSHDSTSLLP